MNKFAESVAIISGIMAIAGGLSFIFNDKGQELAAARDKYIVPLILKGHEFLDTNKSTITKEGNPAFERLIVEFSTQEKVRPSLIQAVKTAEAIISCQASWLCKQSSYGEEFEGEVRALWYNFRPVITSLRRNPEGPNFGSKLERHASQILTRDRSLHQAP